MAAAALALRPKAGCRWDLVSLGEVMLRLDPGEGRIATTRSFQVWEGGGEYNVARGLRRCFGLDTAIVSALADNPVGQLVLDLIRQGGVDPSLLRWVAYDGVGRTVRNGLNFTERGFGLRGALGCSDRGHTAVSQLRPGDIDWDRIFGADGVRWFHTGGVFCGLSDTAPLVAREAMQAARRHGVIVSYDVNYRDSLWQAAGGRARAREVQHTLAPLVDVMLGLLPEDATAVADAASARRALEHQARDFPNLRLAATTLRKVHCASRNDWGALCWAQGRWYEAPVRANLQILDRVGGGDAFAAGFVYGLLAGKDLPYAVACGAAHGALAMTTPGDASMATRAEVEALMRGGAAGVTR